MELLIYFLKFKIKESKGIKILKAIWDFWSMFPAQETCCLEQEMFPAQEVGSDWSLGLSHYLYSLESKGLLQPTLGATLALAIRAIVEYAITEMDSNAYDQYMCSLLNDSQSKT